MKKSFRAGDLGFGVMLVSYLIYGAKTVMLL